MSLSCRPAVCLLICWCVYHVLTNNLFTCPGTLVLTPLSLFPPQTASVALTSHISLWLSSTSSGVLPPPLPSSCPSERSAPHSPLGLPPSRPAVALTGRARWRSPDRSLASGRQPAPTPSLHEGQSDAGECCGGVYIGVRGDVNADEFEVCLYAEVKNKLHTNYANVCLSRKRKKSKMSYWVPLPK